MSCHILLYEPRIEGHHLSWLRYITEDLLSGGFQLTLALDQSPQAKSRIGEQLSDLLPKVRVITARNENGWIAGHGGADTVAHCYQQSGAERVFLCTIDEISSRCLRRAAFGLMPPKILRGKLGGIYIRPRFLAERRFTPNHLLKKFGFHRLFQGGWFRQILLLDEFLHASLKTRLTESPYHFLPDPAPHFNGPDQAEARKRLGLPHSAHVFLYFGGPYRRKGLDLAVEAMCQLTKEKNCFLLCIGQQPKDPKIAQGLDRLNAEGRSLSINRYVSSEEINVGFAACDAVLLPYRKHFGSSSVLSQAAAAGKPVIASDEELVGRRVRECNLGLLFPSGDAAGLRHSMEQLLTIAPQQRESWAEAARKFTLRFSREAFREALLRSFQ